MKDQSQPPPRAECDRLYEGQYVCALCGSEEYVQGDRFDGPDAVYRGMILIRAGFAADARGCEACRKKFPGSPDAQWSAFGREVARRRSLQSAQKWEPRKGELCEGTIVEWATASMSRGQLVQGVYDGTSGGDAVLIVNGSRRSITPSSLKPLQPTPPAKHEYRVGDEVEGWSFCKRATVRGELEELNFQDFGGLGDDWSGPLVRTDEGRYSVRRDSLRLIRPAASAQPESVPTYCAAEGGYACSCDKCRAPKPSPQPRRDPYAEHRALLESRVGFRTDAEVAISTQMYESATRKPTRAERLRAQHLADLDRPIRTGACLTRDKYGQLLSLKGWPEDSEYKEQV